VKKIASLTIALTLGCSGVAMSQQALTEQEVRTQLVDQGYTNVHDMDFHDGVWTARAKSGDGTRVKLHVDPATGRAFPDEQVSRLSENDIRASLSVDGYTHVHDVDYHHGIWTAKARNVAGKTVRLQIDPESGRIIGSD
jgi:peptidase YpeB-like protein